MKLTFDLFCYIVDSNLAYAFTRAVSAEDQVEWQNDWYEMFKEAYQPDSPSSVPEQILEWMREHFNECSFDTHSFQLKETVPPVPLPRLKLLPDGDGHTFIVPVELEDAFDAWQESVYDQERQDLPMPEGVCMMNCALHRLTFTDPQY